MDLHQEKSNLQFQHGLVIDYCTRQHSPWLKPDSFFPQLPPTTRQWRRRRLLDETQNGPHVSLVLALGSFPLPFLNLRHLPPRDPLHRCLLPNDPVVIVNAARAFTILALLRGLYLRRRQRRLPVFRLRLVNVERYWGASLGVTGRPQVQDDFLRPGWVQRAYCWRLEEPKEKEKHDQLIIEAFPYFQIGRRERTATCLCTSRSRSSTRRRWKSWVTCARTTCPGSWLAIPGDPRPPREGICPRSGFLSQSRRRRSMRTGEKSTVRLGSK